MAAEGLAGLGSQGSSKGAGAGERSDEKEGCHTHDLCITSAMQPSASASQIGFIFDSCSECRDQSYHACVCCGALAAAAAAAARGAIAV